MNILADFEQQLTSQLTFQNGSQMVAIVVYAKYDEIERLALWDDIYSMYHNIRVLWMVEGYFNVIMNEEEKIENFLCTLINVRILTLVQFL